MGMSCAPGQLSQRGAWRAGGAGPGPAGAASLAIARRAPAPPAPGPAQPSLASSTDQRWLRTPPAPRLPGPGGGSRHVDRTSWSGARRDAPSSLAAPPQPRETLLFFVSFAAPLIPSLLMLPPSSGGLLPFPSISFLHSSRSSWSFVSRSSASFSFEFLDLVSCSQEDLELSGGARFLKSMKRL